MKKIAISLLIVLFAIFAFFMHKFKTGTVITTTLAQHETTFQELILGIFPEPYIPLTKFQHNQISIEK